MPLVVDASIAFKWFVSDEGADAAMALLDQNIELFAPDLILTEIGNAMWVRLRKLDSGRSAADAAQIAMRRIFNRIVPSHELLRRAIQIAFELGHPVYDCIYLALCEREQTRLVTADMRLRETLASTPYAALLRETP